MRGRMTEVSVALLWGVTTVCSSLSPVQLFVAPWTVAHQAPLSLEFSRQEHWSGVPFPSLGDLPTHDGTWVCCIADRLYQLSHQGSYYHSLVANSDCRGVLADGCSPLEQAGSPHLLFSPVLVSQWIRRSPAPWRGQLPKLLRHCRHPEEVSSEEQGSEKRDALPLPKVR